MPSGKPTRAVTLRDIADAARVNPSTVSRALRDDPRLRPETCRRVQDVARQLRYQPNPFVTAFATHVRNHRVAPGRATVALLDTYSDNESHVWAKRYEAGVQERAADHGFSVDVFRLRDFAGGSEEISKVVGARGIRGLIIMPVRGQTVLTGFDFAGLACSTIDLSLRHPLLHRASPDYFQGMRLALETLHARRCRRIGFCSYRGEVRRIGSRWLGSYLAWQLDGEPDERLVPHINPHEDAQGAVTDPSASAAHWRECRDQFARWLDQEKPDAVVSNDFFFQDWLRELGMRVPQQVAFAALGLAPGSRTCAGIDQRTDRVGAAAMDLVVSQVYRNEYGLPTIPDTVLVPGAWVDGDSVL